MSYIREPTYEISFRYRRLLVPIDGSENSLMALELALDMAVRYGSRITVLYVDTGHNDADSVVEKAKKRAARYNVSIEYKIRRCRYPESSIANEILEEALSGGYDAVFLGARGTTVNEELQIGSTALAVAANSPTTVILVR